MRHNMNQPLVSVMIPNYNHSKYLDQCIQSAINQSYRNLEIVVLDNASTDNSVEVASKYLYDKRVSVCRNQFNIMNRNYNVLSDYLTCGKYMILLCADDYIYPDFIKEAIEIMEAYPDVGYVHGEKDFVDDKGVIIDYDPFYSCSFVAPGVNAMPIYMVTTVAHPSQGVIRRSAFDEIRGYDKEIDHMNADKTLWFYLSEKYDAAYIREKSCGIRIGEQTETFITQKNLQHPILCHLTIKDFAKYAREKGIPAVYNREEEALNRLAEEFLDYAVGMMSVSDYNTAMQYVVYAKILNRKICETDRYKAVSKLVESEAAEVHFLKELIRSTVNKKRGYPPPEGYIRLNKGIDYGK